ncbi:MAG TPA: hypothetical protein VD811_13745 [Desulfuromonadales bacterium]|nr:hypothetical protein [Desulfuromonadales bacterium]
MSGLHYLHPGVKNVKKFVMPRFIDGHPAKRRGLAAAALAVSLLLGGCGMLPGTLVGPTSDQVLFQQGLDSLQGTTTPKAFSRLAAEFPNSPWTSRARAIEKALGRAKEEQRDSNQLQKKLEECRAEKEQLAGDLRSLEKYTLKLKSLLTEAGIAEPLPPGR